MVRDKRARAPLHDSTVEGDEYSVYVNYFHASPFATILVNVPNSQILRGRQVTSARPLPAAAHLKNRLDCGFRARRLLGSFAPSMYLIKQTA